MDEGDVQVGFLAVLIKVSGVTDASVLLKRKKGSRKDRISQSVFSA